MHSQQQCTGLVALPVYMCTCGSALRAARAAATHRLLPLPGQAMHFGARGVGLAVHVNLLLALRVCIRRRPKRPCSLVKRRHGLARHDGCCGLRYERLVLVQDKNNLQLRPLFVFLWLS
jgi:hypothetical protein